MFQLSNKFSSTDLCCLALIVTAGAMRLWRNNNQWVMYDTRHETYEASQFIAFKTDVHKLRCEMRGAVVELPPLASCLASPTNPSIAP